MRREEKRGGGGGGGRVRAETNEGKKKKMELRM